MTLEERFWAKGWRCLGLVCREALLYNGRRRQITRRMLHHWGCPGGMR
jgi:hypothetical protein